MYRTARTTPISRANLLREAERLGVSRAARNFCVSRSTVYRWRRRAAELEDRPCRPRRSPRQTVPEREAAVLALRMERRWGPDRIGPVLGMSRRTTYRILRRYRAHRLRELFPAQPRTFGRFEASRPGEVVQIDIKGLGRLVRGGGRARNVGSDRRRREQVGWSQLHLAVDAASRQAYVEVRRSYGSEDCIAFVRAAIAHFDALGIRVQRVLTDNGAGYKRRFATACAELGLRHTRTRPYHPWTNGRVERFDRTLQTECVYAERFSSDDERRYAIALWLASYHAERPHTALAGLTPDDWLRAWRVTYV